MAKALPKRILLKILDITWCICCRKRPCITLMGWFDAVVLNRDVLSLAIEAQCDVLGELPDYRHNSFRKAVYRQFTVW